jgi:hypothetical protein
MVDNNFSFDIPKEEQQDEHSSLANEEELLL